MNAQNNDAPGEETTRLNLPNFFRAITKMNVSQNELGKAFNTSTSTVNAWVRKEKPAKPSLSADVIYEGIEECRKSSRKIKKYDPDFLFIQDLLGYMDLNERERSFFETKYNLYKSQNRSKGNSEEISYKSCLLDLIQMSLDQETCPNVIRAYDPAQGVIGIGKEHLIGVKEDGRVLATGSNYDQQCNTQAWRDIVSVACGAFFTVGLKSNGTCLATGANILGNGEIFGWRDITAITSGAFHVLGLKTNGTVVAYGMAGEGQCKVDGWKDVTAIAAGNAHSIALTAGGTVLSTGRNDCGQCDVSDWKDIIAIAADGNYSIGLTGTGQIVAAGDVEYFHFDNWSDIRSIAAAAYHVAGLKKDGSVVTTGFESEGQCDVYRWWNIKAIYAGFFTTIGITADGRVLSTKNKYQTSAAVMDVSGWKLFQADPSAILRVETKFERVRARSESLLEEIKAKALQYTLYMNQFNEFLSAQEPFILNQQEKYDRIFDELCSLSGQVYEWYEKYAPFPPISDLLMKYTAAFLDFYHTLDIREGTPENPLRSYGGNAQAYDSFIDYLTITKDLIYELRMIKEETYAP